MKDIVHQQKKPYSVGPEALKFPPLVVLNGFNQAMQAVKSSSSSSSSSSSPPADNFLSDEAPPKYAPSVEHIQLLQSYFQNIYPALNVQKLELNQCRRVVLINYYASNHTIDIRHYLITCSPVGLTKSIKKIIKGKLPNLHNYNDLADYVLKTNPPTTDGGEGTGEYSSDSEAEDGAENRVVLPQRYSGRGNMKSNKSAVRLKEIGPRLAIRLLKIEEGICEGRVLYHSLKKKAHDEEKKMEAIVVAKKNEKETQRKKMEEIKKKKEEEKAAKLSGKRGERGGKDEEKDEDDDDNDDNDNDEEEQEDNNDVNDFDEDDLDAELRKEMQWEKARRMHEEEEDEEEEKNKNGTKKGNNNKMDVESEDDDDDDGNAVENRKGGGRKKVHFAKGSRSDQGNRATKRMKR